MDIWPIDFNKTLKEISEWLDGWKVERYGSESLNPERYYQGDERCIYTYGCVAEGETNKEKKTCDKVLELLVRIKCINDKLSGKVLSQHLQWREYEQLEEERETLYKEYLDIVTATPKQAAQEPQEEYIEPLELKELLPKILQGNEAANLFQKAIDAKLIEKTANALIWKGTKQLLAYFAEKTSKKFELSNKLDKDGKITTAWKPFEKLFNEPNIKDAKQNWMRLNTTFLPTEHEKVDALF